MSLSKLAESCKKCKYVDTCENKEMEAVGFLQFENGVNNEAGLKIVESSVSQSPVVGIIGHGVNARSTLIKAIIKQFEQGLGGLENGKK